jgi:hypothetical protein
MDNGTQRSSDTRFDDFGFDIDSDTSVSEPLGEDFDPSFYGDPEGDAVWIHVVPESDSDQSLFAIKELSDTQKVALSIAVKRFERFGKRTKAAVGSETDHTGYITFEDFEEGPQREAFLLIYGHALNLFEGKTIIGRARAIEFFFCHNPQALTFDDASAAISEDVRRDVFRLRVMYEFWMGWYILPPMPFMMTSLPAQIDDWASTAGGIAGVVLAQVVWQNPSITESDAIAMAQVRMANAGAVMSAEKLHFAINDLKANYILSANSDNLYLTGRNPSQEIQDAQLSKDGSLREQKSSFWWSRLFT